MNQRRRDGGGLVVDSLVNFGVEMVFAVPGESYLPVLDALHDRPAIRLVTARQEGGAAMMAEAWGKLTGRPGVALVTRGPGASNAMSGLHVARQDSTPLVLLVGQVGRGMLDREAFQEIDYRRAFGQVAKWVAQVDDGRRLPEYLARAFATALSGRPGPVVLALPEDILSASYDTPPARYHSRCSPHPDPRAMAELDGRLKAARRPLVLLGEADWNPSAREALAAFVEAWQLPTVTSFRCQDLLDNRSPVYGGDMGLGINPSLARRAAEADVLLAVGGRLGEVPSQGYRLLDIPHPAQELIQVHPQPEELGKVYQPTLALACGMEPFATAAGALSVPAVVPWQEWTRRARADYLAWSQPTRGPGRLQLAEVVHWLGKRLPDQAIITNGAGNYAAWLHRFYPYRGYRSQLAPTSGSMGYGLPAAIAAKLCYPNRPVVAFAGDGCFQMTLQELGTAVQYGLGIVVVVVNNASWGTIRMHQERRYPGRVTGTDLVNPDFVALARAYGAFGARVEGSEDFPEAFEAALAADGPALLELVTDLEALTPRATLSEIRGG
ncbi:MAG: thiamine pyrophosphate-binding protein [Candidatus Competibacteraceae bacterium]|nr:thiamine pyrophosphate-binding protein [Candidatus Competibacteraceae bacterium]